MMHASNDAGHHGRRYLRECYRIPTDQLRVMAAQAEEAGDYRRANALWLEITRRTWTGLGLIHPAFAWFDPEAERQAELERVQAQAELHLWDKYGRADEPAATDTGERRAS